MYLFDMINKKRRYISVFFSNGARGRTRTDMAVNRWILSPLRLPISPLGRPHYYNQFFKNLKKLFYSTVTLLARLRGLSTSKPFTKDT